VLEVPSPKFHKKVEFGRTKLVFNKKKLNGVEVSMAMVKLALHNGVGATKKTESYFAS
jgi:hypothetical protein